MTQARERLLVSVLVLCFGLSCVGLAVLMAARVFVAVSRAFG